MAKSLGGPKSYMRPEYIERQRTTIENLMLKMPPHLVFVSGNDLDIRVLTRDTELECDVDENMSEKYFEKATVLEDGNYTIDFEGGYDFYMSGENLRINTFASEMVSGELKPINDKGYKGLRELAEKNGARCILHHYRTKTIRLVKINPPTEEQIASLRSGKKHKKIGPGVPIDQLFD